MPDQVRFPPATALLALAAFTAATVPALAAGGGLRTRGRQIVDLAGHPVHLSGFNLGGWFVMESYMSPMDSAHRLRDTFGVMSALDARFGTAVERGLMQTYQLSWIMDQDIRTIAGAGFNLVRIPVWWGQFFDLTNPTPRGWRADAFAVLDQLIRSCRDHGVYAVIDMHGVIGGQSTNPDTGRAGQNTYWSDPRAQQNTAYLWQRIAAHYRGNATIAGYDLINEPAPPPTLAMRQTVLQAYSRLYAAVRAVDPDHIVFIEDTFGSWRLGMLPDPASHQWSNVVYEGHVYRFPTGGETQAQEQADAMTGADRTVQDYADHADWNVPFYVGEFNCFSAGAAAWQHVIASYDRAGIGWTMWSYKAANGVAPNFWGYEDPVRWPERPDPAISPAATIDADWRNWATERTFDRNVALSITP